MGDKNYSQNKIFVIPMFYQADFFSNFILTGNECYLNAAKCRDPTIKLAHDGPCGVRRNTIVCSTPWCWPTYEPVCGSDGITYGMYGHNTGKRPSFKS